MKRIIIGIVTLLFVNICIFAQTSASIAYKATILIEADSMPVQSGQLIVLPNLGLFIADGNTFYSLDGERCPDFTEFRLLENFPFEQVIINDNDFIIKSQQFLMQMDDDDTEILAELDTEDFGIFNGNDSIINLVTIDDSIQYAWYKFDRRTGEIDCVMRQPEPINRIVADDQIDYCIIGNDLYYIYGDECELMVTAEQPIQDIVLVPQGLMFCTDDTLYLINDEDVIPIVDGDFHSMYSDGEVVYVVMKNGNIWRLE